VNWPVLNWLWNGRRVEFLIYVTTQHSRYNDWLRAWRPRGWSSNPGRGKIFLPSTSSRLVLGPTQPPIQWVPGALSQGVKWPGREADHSPPTSPTPHTSSPHSAQLVKHRDNFTFTTVSNCRNDWYRKNNYERYIEENLEGGRGREVKHSSLQFVWNYWQRYLEYSFPGTDT
jgi:hypothetical protein